MSAFETATDFFHACETLKGWEGCKQYLKILGGQVCGGGPQPTDGLAGDAEGEHRHRAPSIGAAVRAKSLG